MAKRALQTRQARSRLSLERNAELDRRLFDSIRDGVNKQPKKKTHVSSKSQPRSKYRLII